MTIQRLDPLRDLLQLQEKMNRLFEEFVARSGGVRGVEALAEAGWRPLVDLLEESDRYVLRADLPGLESSAVDLQVDEGELTIRGQRPPDPAAARDGYLRRERPQGPFMFRIAIPPSVDRQAIQASHHNGVLEVLLPKKHEEAAGRHRVEVR